MAMSRTLKWVLLAALLEMTLVAAGVIVQRWPAPDASAEAQRVFGFIAGGMLFFPAWVGAGTWLGLCELRRRGTTPAEDTRRHAEVTFISAIALAAGVQAWLAGTMLGILPEKAIGIRVVEALTGVFITVAGNFAAKTSPPKGLRAPDPAAWTRASLRIGWCGVATGLVILAGAITAPLDAMIWVIGGSTLAYMTVVVWQRREMYHRPA